jgi:hypothetical protein
MATALNYDDIYALGKRLASALDDHDFLGRWTAQYLAELLAKAEGEAGQARDDARREAFDVVLKLWRHRQHLPTIRPPLSRFDYVFATLDRLADDSPWGYSGLFNGVEAPTSNRSEEISLLAVACLIDMKARDAIRLAVALAGEYAAEEEEQWTAVAHSLLDEDYRRAIRRIRRLRRDPQQGSDAWPDTDEENPLDTEPTLIVAQRLIGAIDSLSEVLLSAKQVVEEADT